jgi:hypothetical protein
LVSDLALGSLSVQFLGMEPCFELEHGLEGLLSVARNILGNEVYLVDEKTSIVVELVHLRWHLRLHHWLPVTCLGWCARRPEHTLILGLILRVLIGHLLVVHLTRLHRVENWRIIFDHRGQILHEILQIWLITHVPPCQIRNRYFVLRP